MKGIVLAAGKGTRLYPMTRPVCKPLLPVYDKPLIYYALSSLMQAGIHEILIIVPSGETETFLALLGNGESFGIEISYAEQHVPRGIAEAFLIGRDFIGADDVCLALGDNIFYSPLLSKTLRKAKQDLYGATVFGFYVDDPRPFGVVEFDKMGKAISIEEKPSYPKSNYIIPGLYFYDNQVVDIASKLKPSARGELEITDVNLAYLSRGQLNVIPLEKDVVWIDAGTADSLLHAASTVCQIQKQTGRYIACLEELGLYEGWLTQRDVQKAGEQLSMTPYGRYLLSL